MQAQLYLSYECRSHCSECKKQNGNYCNTCKNNLYLSEGACSSSCSSNLGYDFIDGKKACINCKATYGQYVDNNKCTDMIKGKFAYPDSKYGVLYPCNSNCTSCRDKATNCQSCINGLYVLNDTECVPECKTLRIGEDKCYNCTGDYAYFQDIGCVKCLDDAENYMLLKNESNHCFKGIPAGNYSDANRILHPCHEYCTLCKDSPTNCSGMQKFIL